MLPLEPSRVKPQPNNGIATDSDGIGLTAAEFIAAADSLLENGLHP